MMRRTALSVMLAALVVPAGAAFAGAVGVNTRDPWADFKQRFVKGGRVVDNGNKGITHTEGQGVAMLAAVWAEDRASFTQLWEFTNKNLKRSDGLFSWKWVPGQGVADPNNATDGDLYIAWALYKAGLLWRDRELIHAAEELAEALRKQCLVRTRLGPMLLPGKDGFVKADLAQPEIVLNPSYWVLPAYRALHALTGQKVWSDLHTAALAGINAAAMNPRGLPGDWVVLNDPLTPWGERPARFGYEAIRIPLFLAWDDSLSGPAAQQLAKHMQPQGFPAWVGLMDASKAEYVAPAGFLAVARLVQQRRSNTAATAVAVDTDYFSSSLSLMVAVAQSGWR